MTSIQLLLAKILGVITLGIGLFVWGHHVGSNAVHEEWQASITKDAVTQANLVHASDIVTNTVITQTIDRVQVVVTAGATLTREVTKYVDAKTDAAYRVPLGFGCVYNAAITSQAVDALCSGGTYDAPLAAPLSDVAAVIAQNASDCQADRERFRGLQQWIKAQQELTNKAP